MSLVFIPKQLTYSNLTHCISYHYSISLLKEAPVIFLFTMAEDGEKKKSKASKRAFPFLLWGFRDHLQEPGTDSNSSRLSALMKKSLLTIKSK